MTKIVQVRMSDDFLETVKRAADREEWPTSVWIRQAIKEKLSRDSAKAWMAEE